MEDGTTSCVKEHTTTATERPVAPADENELFERYGWLADAVARRFYVRGADRDDLRQVAAIGLLAAHRRYDAERGVAFTTYASKVVAGHLKHHFRDRRWGVSVVRRVKDDWTTARMAIDVLSQELGRSPTVADIADFAGIDEARVVAAIEAGATFRMVPVSPTPGASADDPAIDPPARERPIERLDDALAIQSAIERLSPEDRELVHLSVWEELTQMQIAERLGVSQMTVSRRLRTIYARLGAWLVTAGAA